MPSTSRRKNISVIQKLIETPCTYSFNQAVRLLERATANFSAHATIFAKKPVARFSPPLSENLRFCTTQSLSFPASDITKISIKKNSNEANQWKMHINFMGLTGSSGVMPYHYSEFVLKRQKLKDTSIRDFFDIFNHRQISLFYQASIKYNLSQDYERSKLHVTPTQEPDHHTHTLLSLIGIGTTGLQHRLYTRDESLVFYAGLLTKKVRTAAGLKQIIHHHFSIPVEIREFIGQWQDLIDDVRTRLPGMEVPRGQNNQLGKSVLLGRKGWFSQGKIRIILGPLNKKQLHTFAPGTTALKALDEIVRLYINFEHDYDYVMRIRKSDIPNRIELSKKSPPVMGWNTWLAPKMGNNTSASMTVDIPVSACRLR